MNINASAHHVTFINSVKKVLSFYGRLFVCQHEGESIAKLSLLFHFILIFSQYCIYFRSKATERCYVFVSIVGLTKQSNFTSVKCEFVGFKCQTLLHTNHINYRNCFYLSIENKNGYQSLYIYIYLTIYKMNKITRMLVRDLEY